MSLGLIPSFEPEHAAEFSSLGEALAINYSQNTKVNDFGGCT